VKGDHAKDRRAQKTRRQLHDALVSLIHEKTYDSIAVKEIVDRANVGRSAFYAHFQDKDALLANGIHQMLQERSPRVLPSSARRFSMLVWFSLPVFEHIDRFRHFGGSMMGRKSRAIVHEHLRQVLIERIKDDVGPDLWQRAVSGMPPDLLADYVVATFILVLNWWVGTRSTLSPREADDLFLSMVVPTLEAIDRIGPALSTPDH
jgi:AcrR family transcriptional regulator